MKQNAWSSASKLILITCFVSISIVAAGQRKPPKNPLESFLDTQFWLGLRMGINSTKADPVTRYSGLSPIDYNADSLKKSYRDFVLPGGQMGLEMNFYHRGFSVSFQPAYKVSRFSYTSHYGWYGDQPSDRFETTYKVEQKLDIIDLPLMFKRDILTHGKVRPFVMAGGYYSIIASAQKRINTRQTDYSSGTPLTSKGNTLTLGGKDGYQNFSGISGGAGVNLDYWNIRTVLEIGYKHALTPVTVPGSRETEFASIGDVNDELKLLDFNIGVSLVFPMRFIDQQFKAY